MDVVVRGSEGRCGRQGPQCRSAASTMLVRCRAHGMGPCLGAQPARGHQRSNLSIQEHMLISRGRQTALRSPVVTLHRPGPIEAPEAVRRTSADCRRAGAPRPPSPGCIDRTDRPPGTPDCRRRRTPSRSRGSARRQDRHGGLRPPASTGDAGIPPDRDRAGVVFQRPFEAAPSTTVTGQPEGAAGCCRAPSCSGAHGRGAALSPAAPP